MFALLDNQGTAAAETALCSVHVNDSASMTEAILAAREDVPLPQDFNDCSGNDALECIVCGATE